MSDLYSNTPVAVTYDTHDRRELALALVESLRAAADLNSGELGAGPADRLRDGLAQLRARLRRDFNLVVIGEFKRGKSTLVNALLGARVVSADVTPETVFVQEISFGPERRVTAVLEDGGRVDLGADVATREALEGLEERLPGSLASLCIQDASPFLDGVTITDTPGTGDLMWRFDERVQGYLPRADAILYVISALSPLSESERTFLTMTLRPMELSKVVFVVNMVDGMRSEADVERVSNRIAEKIHRHFPDSPVFPVSALDQLSRACGEEPLRDGLEARFARLEAHLTESVLLNRDVVQLQNTLRDCRRLVSRTRSDALTLVAGLDQDGEELKGRREDLLSGEGDVVARFRVCLAGLDAAHLQSKAAGRRWLDGFVDRLFEELLPQLNGLEHDVVQKHLPFFLNDALREAWTAVMESQRGVLADELMRSAAECSGMLGGEGDSVSDAAQQASFHPPGISGAAQALVGLSFAASFLTVPALLAKGMLAAVGLAEKSNDTRRAVQFREHLTDSFPGLRDSIRQAHGSASEELHAKARTALQEHFDDERVRWLATADVALEAHGQGEAELGRCRKVATDFVQRCDALEPQLEALRVG